VRKNAPQKNSHHPEPPPLPFTLPNGDTPLCTKQLAAAIHRHPSYLYAMRASGFPMPAGLSTPNAALQWLINNPKFKK
jgi:hypothetical protein